MDSKPDASPNSGDLKKKFSENPIYKEMEKDLNEIHPRFSPESNFAETGKGKLKSESIEKLQEIKKQEKKRRNTGHGKP